MSTRNKNIIVLLLLLVALLPYYLLCFYALPFADDFCYGWTSAENISFFQRFMRQYMGCSGRYMAHLFLCNHPLITGRLLYYQLALLIPLLILPLVIFAFIKRWVQGNLSAFTISLFITLFYLSNLPQLTEGAYWFTGIANYQLGDIAFIIHLTLLMAAFPSTGAKKYILLFTAAFFLITSTGFNEEAATLIPAFYLFAIAVAYTNKSVQRPIISGLFVVSLICSLVVFLAPGNWARNSMLNTPHLFFHSVFYAALQTFRFTGKWVFSVPLLGLSLIVLANPQTIKNTFALNFDYRFIIALLLLTVFTGAFLPYFATGILGQHRTINYVFFFFIFWWLWLLVSLSVKFSLHQKMQVITGGSNTFVIAVACIIVMMITGNGGKIIRSKPESFRAYSKEFMQRQKAIIANPGLPVQPLKNMPAVFTITDTRADSTWWVDKCTKYFYTGTAIRLR
ncbi:MAG TPA: DUF6056 family protein [Chitinophagales bacterium]|nr:DUF6056 family protein [Chitinophagales bacterium]